jgi:hypothetical protein
VVEVKTSRKDFQQDTKWNRAPAADIQAMAYPRGLIRPHEFPAGWWMLEHIAETGLVEARRRTPRNTISIEQRLLLVTNIAERRHNREANAFWSALHKRQRSGA